MLTIGLTGGIGSGKTTVANYFAELGIAIIDTDVIAHQIVEPGTPALKKIIDHFGPEILNSDQALNRKKLANTIFNNPTEKSWLENLLHPLILAEVEKAKAKVHSPYCIVVIPLLVETQPNPAINRILVVDAPEQLRINRTRNRDQRSESEITAIITAQASTQKRLNAADDIITNDQGLTELGAAVQELHQRYLKLATE